MEESQELPTPSDCIANPDAFELLSIWVCSNEPRVQFRNNPWEDPAAWGIVLADLAGMVAQQYQDTTELSFDDAMARIISGFRAELDSGA
jgi:hypothetical protein